MMHKGSHTPDGDGGKEQSHRKPPHVRASMSQKGPGPFARASAYRYGPAPILARGPKGGNRAAFEFAFTVDSFESLCWWEGVWLTPDMFRGITVMLRGLVDDLLVVGAPSLHSLAKCCDPGVATAISQRQKASLEPFPGILVRGLGQIQF
jgi:hypothetical protein